MFLGKSSHLEVLKDHPLQAQGTIGHDGEFIMLGAGGGLGQLSARQVPYLRY